MPFSRLFQNRIPRDASTKSQSSIPFFKKRASVEATPNTLSTSRRPKKEWRNVEEPMPIARSVRLPSPVQYAPTIPRSLSIPSTLARLLRTPCGRLSDFAPHSTIQLSPATACDASGQSSTLSYARPIAGSRVARVTPSVVVLKSCARAQLPLSRDARAMLRARVRLCVRKPEVPVVGLYAFFVESGALHEALQALAGRDVRAVLAARAERKQTRARTRGSEGEDGGEGGGGFGEEAALAIATQVAEALACAHDAGFAHGAVTPEHVVFLCARGGMDLRREGCEGLGKEELYGVRVVGWSDAVRVSHGEVRIDALTGAWHAAADEDGQVGEMRRKEQMEMYEKKREKKIERNIQKKKTEKKKTRKEKNEKKRERTERGGAGERDMMCTSSSTSSTPSSVSFLTTSSAVAAALQASSAAARTCTQDEVAEEWARRLEYSAPETVLHARHCARAADVYGLGGVLYSLLSGSAPFAASTRGGDGGCEKGKGKGKGGGGGRRRGEKESVVEQALRKMNRRLRLEDGPWRAVSARTKAVVAECLSADVAVRPGARAVVARLRDSLCALRSGCG